MVSYIAHNRRGPATGGCGCGGARPPIPLTQQPIQQVSQVPTSSPVISDFPRISFQIQKQNSVPISIPQANADLIKPVKLTHVEKPIEVKPVVEQKNPVSSAVQIDLRDNSVRFTSYNRGISRENSYNKMNLPRKGCCGHPL